MFGDFVDLVDGIDGFSFEGGKAGDDVAVAIEADVGEAVGGEGVEEIAKGLAEAIFFGELGVYVVVAKVNDVAGVDDFGEHVARIVLAELGTVCGGDVGGADEGHAHNVGSAPCFGRGGGLGRCLGNGHGMMKGEGFQADS